MTAAMRCLPERGDTGKECNNIVPFFSPTSSSARLARARRLVPPSSPFDSGEQCCYLVRTLVPDRATTTTTAERTWESVRDHATRAPPGRRLYLSVLGGKKGHDQSHRYLLAYQSEADAGVVCDELVASVEAGLADRRRQQRPRRSVSSSVSSSASSPSLARRLLRIERWSVEELLRASVTAGMGVVLYVTDDEEDKSQKQTKKTKDGGHVSAIVFPAPDADSEEARAQTRAALLNGWGWRG